MEKFKIDTDVFCIDESMYNMHLTKHNVYKVHKVDLEKQMIRIKGDAGRLVWISTLCFSKIKQPKIVKIAIDDALNNSNNVCVEVTIKYENNARRWTTFMTVQYLQELLIGGKYFHSGKFIFVKSLSKKIILETIKELDLNNELNDVTRSY